MNYLTASVTVTMSAAEMDNITNLVNNGGKMFKIEDSAKLN